MTKWRNSAFHNFIVLAPCPSITVIIESATLCMEWNFKCSWPTFSRNELCVEVTKGVVHHMQCTALEIVALEFCSDWVLCFHGKRSKGRHPPSTFYSYSQNKLNNFLSVSWKTTVFGIASRRITQWTSAPKKLLLNLICWICKVELLSCAPIKSAKRKNFPFPFRGRCLRARNCWVLTLCAIVLFNCLCDSRIES